MEETKLTSAALPLAKDHSVYALVMGSREGMRRLLGSHTEKLEKNADEAAWAMRRELCCLIGDESAPVYAQADDCAAPETFAGRAARLLMLRFQAGLPGLTLLPCAEAEHNGAHLQEAVIACAVQWRYDAGFLRWLLAENRFCSTLTDCTEWLIETQSPEGMPIPETEGAVRYVPALAPYRQRRQWMLGGAGVLTAACGALCGLESCGETMRDADIRALLGHVLTQEMLSCLDFEHTEGLRYAARVCAYLENACGGEKWPEIGEYLVRRLTGCILPAIMTYEKRCGTLPNGLCFALSAVIMLYAGVRMGEEKVYILPGAQGDMPALEEERVLSAFAHMSCDMPPESLAYAVLSDREIWGSDLREIAGLEEKVTSQLRDMQILGVREAMRAAGGQ